MTRRSIWLAVLALCLAQAFAAQCSNDSCLSAIRNAPTGRNATADCLFFLELQASPTGTPSRRTTTITVISTKRVASLTLHRSATVTTKTGQTSPSTSEIEVDGKHKRTEVENDVVNGNGPGYLAGQALQGRRATTSSTTTALPLYAKKCASEADYSSACSCLGLSRITRAAVQPVTTKTVTAIRTVANVTLPPFFANTTRLAGNGTVTVGSMFYTGSSSGSTSSTRPTTLFTSRVTSSKGTSSGSWLSSVSRTTFSSSKATFRGTTSNSRLTTASSLSQFSSNKPPIYVVTIATVTTTKEPVKTSTKSTLGQITGKTAGALYTNSTAALATASANITASFSWLDATTRAKYPIPINSTASWYNGTSTTSYPLETGTGVLLTTGTGIILTTGTGSIRTTSSARVPYPMNTTSSWYNGTLTSFLPLGTGTGRGIILTTGTGSPITTTTARVPYPLNATAPWSNGTSTTFLPQGTGTGTGTGVILTTGTGVTLTTAPVAFPTATISSSVRFPFPLNTTAFWSNGTATTTGLPVQGTGTGILVTGTGYYNSTPTTTTSAAKPTATEDLTCGETTTPFSLRVSQPGGTFDKWFVHVVGNGLLFTSSQSQASAFSVEGTGHLCAVGYSDSKGKPRIAAVGVAGAEDGVDGEAEGGEGPVWMLRQGTLKAYWEDYRALECTKDDGGLSCAPANSTASVGGGWVGCGLMLSMGRDVDLGYGGLNCSSVSLEVVES